MTVNALHLEKDDCVELTTKAGIVEATVNEIDPFTNTIVVTSNGQKLTISPDDLKSSEIADSTAYKDQQTDCTKTRNSKKRKLNQVWSIASRVMAVLVRYHSKNWQCI